MLKISELIQTNRSKKYEGMSFNQINVLKYIGSNSKSRVAAYECSCNVCNQIFISSSSNFTADKYKHGCRQCSIKALSLSRTMHGFNQTNKVYKTWCKIRERCYNKNSKDYPLYGQRGIIMQKEFIDDFLVFYAEVGEAPENTKNWSIDRIDPSKGYIQGNIRWANILQQARNKRKSSVNTTGVTGVQWYSQEYNTKSGLKAILYAVTTWSEYVNGKPKTMNKKFSVTQHGLLPAFAEAVKYRIAKIEELDRNGYNYGKQHGL
jgi:hypothetical protein